MKFFLIMALTLVLCGTGLYLTTSSYDNRQDKLEILEAKIAHEDTQADILKAEWSYLSRPERVLTMSSDLLKLQPISKDRVVPLEALPYRGESFLQTTAAGAQ